MDRESYFNNVYPFRLYTEYGYTWIADWRSHLPNPISDDLGQILDQLLAKDIQQRYQSAAEVLQALDPPPPPPLPPTIPPRQQIPAQPPIRAKHSGRNISVNPISSPSNASPLPNFPLGRRKIIQLAGLSSVGVVGAIAIGNIIKTISRRFIVTTDNDNI